MNIKNILTVFIFLILSRDLFSQTTAGIQWQRAIGGKGSESPKMTAKTNDGGYIILSNTDSSSVAVTGSHRRSDIWVVKINASGAIEWQKALGGSGDDNPSAIFVNNDGTYTVAGFTNSNDFDVSGNHQNTNGSDDLWVVKLSSTGTILWQRCYGGSNEELPRSWIKNSAGNIVFAAYTLSFDGDVSGFHSGLGAGGDIWVAEINNSNGNIVAQKAYGGSWSEAPRSLIQQSDGKYVITGYTQSNDGDVSGTHQTPGNHEEDIWVLKLNTITSIAWQKCLGSIGAVEFGYQVSESANRSLIVLGEATSNGGDVTGHHGGSDVWIVKLDESSNILWQRSLGGSSTESAMSFFENSDASIIVLANTTSNNGDVSGYHSGTQIPPAEDMWIVKLNGNGILQWQKTYGGSERDGFYGGFYPSTFAGKTPSIFKQADGDYVLLGFTNSANGDVIGFHPPNNFPTVMEEDVWMLKVSDLNGAIQWQRCLGGTSTDRLIWGDQISSTEFLISAFSRSLDGDVTGPRMSSNTDFDSWIVKLGSANSIKGVVFVDNNNNGLKDAGEPFYSKVLVKSEKPGYARTHVPVNGVFLNEVDTGSYISTLSLNYPYYTVLPVQRTSVFANYFNVDSFGFALSPIPNKKDLMIGIIALSGVKPGFSAAYKILYENLGTVVMTGSVKFVKDNRASFISSVPAPASVVADTITYNFSNFNPLGVSSIIIELKIAGPPTVNINDTLRNSAMIFPQTGDETIFNNNDTILQRVTGSFDPNDKTESHGAFITTAEIYNGEQLSYLIRFQNTGTDTAYNIVVKDTLDAKLQWDKIQMISSSHPCSLQIAEGKYLSWRFNNIKLVDSTRNEPASHGYIYFRIKPQTNLTFGDTIRNNASIYFDFNPPVKTNTVTVVVKGLPIVTGLNNPIPLNDWDIVAYPNPTNGVLNIVIRGKVYGNIDFKITDQLGRNIVRQNLGEKNTSIFKSQINLATLKAGIYYLTILSPKDSKSLTINIR